MPATVTAPTPRTLRVKITQPYNGEDQHLSKRELHRLLDVLGKSQNGNRDYLLGLVGYLHALRASELIGLRWVQIDWDTKQIKINRLKGSVSKLHHDMEDDEVRLLKAHLKAQRAAGIASPHVFLASRGNQPITRTGLFLLMQRAGERAGIAGMHPHRLRHSRLQHLAVDGASVMALRAIGGHKRNENLEQYLKTVAVPLASLPRSPR